ncbi:Ribonuclease III [Hyphodiscus hymeniophilus]|uniref:Ribonuclease III n=1 Tax=Hyphodiscus hymeniophilus TaxID=353542 RepID=A0A9P7B036_9HELO|nr:Ribonuclease III [Hyphodiscus hymeniophilus]
MSQNPPSEPARNSIQSSALARPESTVSSFSFSTRSKRPQSIHSNHHSVHTTASRSSTVQGSIYSQDEKDPLIPTFTTPINEKGETELKYHGDQLWEPQSQSQASGGQRTEFKHQRGCVMPRASIDNQARWKRRVQDILEYDFRDVDLLEEALESPGSGVTVVGKSTRHFLDGNSGLAKVGEAAMTLVLRDQCYLFYRTEKESEDAINSIIENRNLHLVGMSTTLQQYIRPHAPIRPSQSRSIFGNIKHEVKAIRSDPVRSISNGIKAIIGAVYFDSGYDTARRVMAHLGLIIKLPEPTSAPVPNFGHMIRYA